MENKKEATWEATLGNLGILVFDIASVFYRNLLLVLVWGWFIADKLFEVSYWGMFLVTLIVGLFVGGKNSYFSMLAKLKKVFKEEKQLDLAERVGVRIQSFVVTTIKFGIIWLVYVIIT